MVIAQAHPAFFFCSSTSAVAFLNIDPFSLVCARPRASHALQNLQVSSYRDNLALAKVFPAALQGNLDPHAD